MADPLFLKIKADLPEFPEEVITDWLLPYAQREGWPPTSARWQKLLPQGIAYWKNVRWEKRQMTLDDVWLTPVSAGHVWGLHEAYDLKIDNDYSRQIEDGHDRYMRAVTYFIQAGEFPKPIVALQCANGLLEIVDGNHRYLAWNGAIKLSKELDSLPHDKRNDFVEKVKVSLSIDKIARVADTQAVFVALPPSISEEHGP